MLGMLDERRICTRKRKDVFVLFCNVYNMSMIHVIREGMYTLFSDIELFPFTTTSTFSAQDGIKRRIPIEKTPKNYKMEFKC